MLTRVGAGFLGIVPYYIIMLVFLQEKPNLELHILLGFLLFTLAVLDILEVLGEIRDRIK